MRWISSMFSWTIKCEHAEWLSRCSFKWVVAVGELNALLTHSSRLSTNHLSVNERAGDQFIRICNSLISRRQRAGSNEYEATYVAETVMTSVKLSSRMALVGKLFAFPSFLEDLPKNYQFWWNLIMEAERFQNRLTFRLRSKYFPSKGCNFARRLRSKNDRRAEGKTSNMRAFCSRELSVTSRLIQ